MEVATQIVLDCERGIQFPLTLTSHISAWQQVGSTIEEGGADVVYKFTARENQALTVQCHNGAVLSRKSTDVGVQALPDDLRTEIRRHMVSDMQYDLRALAFGLGALCARLHTGKPMPTRYARYNFLSTSIMSMGDGDLLITPPTGQAKAILFVLGVCARMCGCDNVFVVSERMALAQAPRTFDDWSAFLHAASRFLLADAINAGYGVEHLLAMGRGYYSGVSLNGHTDEGGWVRALFRSAVYPLPRGIINSVPASVTLQGIFSDCYDTTNDLVSSCLKIAVTMGAAVQDADPMLRDGGVTVLERFEEEENIGNAPGSPCNFEGLKDAAYNILDHCGFVLGLTFLQITLQEHKDVMRQTTGAFFKPSTDDRHLHGNEIMPYAYVEHGCVLRHPMFAQAPGPKAGQQRKLELFPNSVYKVGDESIGTYVGGRNRYQQAGLQIKDCCLRDIGAYYVYSSRWGSNAKHAAQHTRLISTSSKSGRLTDAINMPRLTSGEDTLDSMAWLRPHCPVPLMGECGFDGVGAVFQVDPIGRDGYIIEGGTQQQVNLTCSPLLCKFSSGGWDVETSINRQMSASFIRKSGKRYNTQRQSSKERIMSLFPDEAVPLNVELKDTPTYVELLPATVELGERDTTPDITAPRSNNTRLTTQALSSSSRLAAEETSQAREDLVLPTPPRSEPAEPLVITTTIPEDEMVRPTPQIVRPRAGAEDGAGGGNV